jgi:hypothetical protein
VLDCIVEHGGISEQQKRDGTLVTQYLARHDTVVQVKFQPLTPSDLSGDPRTDPLSAPRTVAFWGRGVATSWRLTIEDPSVNLDGISEIQFGVGFTGFLSPDVQFTLPAPESTVSGTVTVRAKATRVSGIKFQAQYSDGAAVGWHDLEGSKETAPGVWEATWDTRSVPNQGDAALGTVMLAAVAVDANGNDLNRSKYCRVEVKNGV